MLNEDNVQQKLECITSAQDSIQSVSLWVIHHKSESNQLVKIWLKVLKKVDVSQKLLLFYLCNDVVQNCKRKQAVEFLESFKGVLGESIQLVKDTTIKPKVLRILNIWQERNVYKAKFITKLKAILVTPSPVSKEVYKATKKDPKSNGTKESKAKETPAVQKIDSAQLLAEFKPQLFIHKVTDLRKLELENDIKQQQLSKVKFDESSLDTIKQLKDKTQGNEFSKNFEEAVAKLESTVKYLEQDVNDRGEVIDLAETSQLFYDEQYKEAKIVVNAYRNFGTRINNMKKKVEDIKNKFPATPSPIPSPTGLLDAPSPEPTPPQEDPNDYADPLDMDIDSDDEMKQKRGELLGFNMPFRV
ncbi:hypothetical protein LOTGIDRAFT_102650 [Lottia gigantea]|uniref:Regulation of nuclear pre-mRNA domain-containing protein 2 n=1 Tax=Lottia gigantea TaxID=225164 RepID=V4BHM3_LOTGI|nr:hypothetical protein LOTGIDRAFT_102650 [Lottia gigantea]ESP05352.1 hypothetical protein LOTGIDRAFT_102650 [Lottia gigantea]